SRRPANTALRASMCEETGDYRASLRDSPNDGRRGDSRLGSNFSTCDACASTLAVKSNSLARLVRRLHQLPDRFENRGNLLVVAFDPFLQLGQLAREFPVGGEHFAQLHKSSHDLNVYVYGALAPQHTGEHRDALLGEGVRHKSAQAAAGRYHRL